jgi:hypothetical protein
VEFSNVVTIKEKGCQIKKGIKKNDEKNENKTCLLFAYHPTTTIILQ